MIELQNVEIMSCRSSFWSQTFSHRLALKQVGRVISFSYRKFLMLWDGKVGPHIRFYHYLRFYHYQMLTACTHLSRDTPRTMASVLGR